ncbi:hypothetical protein BpHYR1_003257 [Brachionus plicatilis]|uniref:Uncharacterized protein n=1 Tax=Brachionus plicatilis TaxID=10195 RepID=A0A3M7PM00_BRAPC|nr:hypothetical protein BpHYR1_003257 [Brachionus plicatilis]
MGISTERDFCSDTYIYHSTFFNLRILKLRGISDLIEKKLSKLIKFIEHKAKIGRLKIIA